MQLIISFTFRQRSNNETDRYYGFLAHRSQRFDVWVGIVFIAVFQLFLRGFGLVSNQIKFSCLEIVATTSLF